MTGSSAQNNGLILILVRLVCDLVTIKTDMTDLCRRNERLVIVCDPMLATGGSAIQAVDFLKDKGCKNIKFMCIIAAPEGLDALRTAHPDIDIYVGNLDEKLNEDARLFYQGACSNTREALV